MGALEPVTTAASPLAGAPDPIRDAVQEGLGDAGFVQGLSNLGFDEDARSVADAASDFFVAPIEAATEVFENTGEALSDVLEAQADAASVVAEATAVATSDFFDAVGSDRPIVNSFNAGANLALADAGAAAGLIATNAQTAGNLALNNFGTGINLAEQQANRVADLFEDKGILGEDNEGDVMEETMDEEMMMMME